MAFLFLIPALILVYLIPCFVIFRIAFSRHEDSERDTKRETRQIPFPEFADSIPKSRQWLADNHAQEVSITSFDGNRLMGKWVPHENPRATILLVHGYHGNYVNSFGMVYDFYREMRFNLLMFRQRGNGESQGRYITFGVHEHRDLLSWITFHNASYGKLPLFISGISMGASTVLYTVDKDLPENVRGVTADCGYTSPYDILKKVISHRIHFNGGFLMPGVNLWCRLLAKFDLKECSTLQTLANAKVPVLLIHGAADDFVPCEMTRQGYAACTGEKHLIIVEEAGHGVSFLVERERVLADLRDFFNRHLG